MESLSPEQQAVFEAIEDQRRRASGDYFEYDFRQGQTFLNLEKYSVKYNIDEEGQARILGSLERGGIVEIEYKWEPIPSVPGVIVFDKNPKYYYRYFITLSVDGIHRIRDKYFKNIPAKLILDDSEHSLIVITRTGKYRLPPMHEEQLPYRVIKYVMSLSGNRKFATRSDLNKNGIPVGEQQLSSKIFEKNDTVKRILKPFIELKPGLIAIGISTRLTGAELEEIQKVSK